MLCGKGNLTPRQNKAQMCLKKFSNLQNIHTAGTNLTVADMLCRHFSEVTNKVCHLHRKTLPPHNEFMQLKPDNALKQNHYLVKHEDVFPTTTMIHTQSQMITVMTNIYFRVFRIKILRLNNSSRFIFLSVCLI